MRGPTHALAGACTASVFLWLDIPYTVPILALSAIAGFSALIPDLDGSESTIENIRILGVRPLKGPGYIVNILFKHRGFLHSLMALVFLTFILLGFFPQLPREIVLAILLGYLSHLVTDDLTPAGIPWLYPVEWRPTLLPKILCIRIGSFMELVFMVGLVVYYVIFLQQAGYVSLR